MIILSNLCDKGDKLKLFSFIHVFFIIIDLFFKKRRRHSGTANITGGFIESDEAHLAQNH